MKNKSKGPITELDLLNDISNKLSQLIDLMGVAGKEKEEQIKRLVSKGYSNGDIANLLCIPKGTVDSIRAKFKGGKK